MLCKQAKQGKGFTLIEMLVVVVIIIIVAGMALPSMSSFMRQRKLKGAGSMIQGVCTEARARAIAQREQQYVVFLVNNNAYNPGGIRSIAAGNNANTIYSFDTDGTTDTTMHQLISMERLPEFTRYDQPANNFHLSFFSDGTVGFSPNIVDQYSPADPANSDPDVGTNTDIIIAQDRMDLRCYLDIIQNTGRTRYNVK